MKKKNLFHWIANARTSFEISSLEQVGAVQTGSVIGFHVEAWKKPAGAIGACLGLILTARDDKTDSDAE